MNWGVTLLFCRHCGSKLRDTAAFCTKCGAAVASTSAAAKPETTNLRRISTVLCLVIIGAVAWIGFRTLATPRTLAVAKTDTSAKIEPSAKVGSSASEPAPPETEPEAGSSVAETEPSLPSVFLPKFDVTIHTGGGNSDAVDDRYGIVRVKMILTDDSPTTILRIIVNGRVGATTGCDFSSGDPLIFVDSDNLMGQPPRPEPRLRLNTGDYVLVPASCGELVTLKIVTDRGTVDYHFR